VVSPSVLEEIFHVKSCVSTAFFFIVFRYLLIAFITYAKLLPLSQKRSASVGGLNHFMYKGPNVCDAMFIRLKLYLDAVLLNINILPNMF
jgi:hypothetical protein